MSTWRKFYCTCSAIIVAFYLDQAYDRVRWSLLVIMRRNKICFTSLVSIISDQSTNLWVFLKGCTFNTRYREIRARKQNQRCFHTLLKNVLYVFQHTTISFRSKKKVFCLMCIILDMNTKSWYTVMAISIKYLVLSDI